MRVIMQPPPQYTRRHARHLGGAFVSLVAIAALAWVAPGCTANTEEDPSLSTNDALTSCTTTVALEVKPQASGLLFSDPGHASATGQTIAPGTIVWRQDATRGGDGRAASYIRVKTGPLAGTAAWVDSSELRLMGNTAASRKVCDSKASVTERMESTSEPMDSKILHATEQCIAGFFGGAGWSAGDLGKGLAALGGAVAHNAVPFAKEVLAQDRDTILSLMGSKEASDRLDSETVAMRDKMVGALAVIGHGGTTLHDYFHSQELYYRALPSADRSRYVCGVAGRIGMQVLINIVTMGTINLVRGGAAAGQLAGQIAQAADSVAMTTAADMSSAIALPTATAVADAATKLPYIDVPFTVILQPTTGVLTNTLTPALTAHTQATQLALTTAYAAPVAEPGALAGAWTGVVANAQQLALPGGVAAAAGCAMGPAAPLMLPFAGPLALPCAMGAGAAELPLSVVLKTSVDGATLTNVTSPSAALAVAANSPDIHVGDIGVLLGAFEEDGTPIAPYAAIPFVKTAPGYAKIISTSGHIETAATHEEEAVVKFLMVLRGAKGQKQIAAAKAAFYGKDPAAKTLKWRSFKRYMDRGNIAKALEKLKSKK
ncbi:MAG: hypothetical protein NVSMB1_01570 [Polyangiales bacterium]